MRYLLCGYLIFRILYYGIRQSILKLFGFVDETILRNLFLGVFICFMQLIVWLLFDKESR